MTSKLPPFLRSLFAAGQPTENDFAYPEPTLERWVREYARQMRIRLRRSAAGDRIAADRFARAKSRAALRGLRRERPRQLEKDVLIARYRPSPILDALVPERRQRWRDIMRRQQPPHPESIEVRDFSFLTHPDETLAALKRIGEVESRELQAVINFRDSHCLDAGSFLVLAEVWPRMAPVFIGGHMARSIQRVLSATGVSRNNRMQMRGVPDDRTGTGEKVADVWPFPLQRRRPALSSRSATVHLDPQAREIACGRFCDAVDDWLAVPEIDQQLTIEGKGWLASIIGELLDNAERHSQPNSNDGDWSTTAFMVRRMIDGKAVLKCYIAFLSVGRSFAESLADAAHDVSESLKAYTDRHLNCGLSAGSLATVYALQDTITCDPAAREARSGGTGLQDVLEFVEALAGDGPASADSRVSIISGNTCIALTSDYIPGTRRGERQPRLQWCNRNNTSEQPPDPTVVFDLAERFAGTLVSVAFTLDPEYLAATVENEENGDDRS